MNILAIDMGTYSIKLVEFRPERKNLLVVEKHEFILSDFFEEFPNAKNTSELQKEIIIQYIHKKITELKIIFQIPNDLITTRYLEIPGTSKRKAEQIIPFQLDEILPYSLSNAHFSSRLSKKPNSFSVLSNITQFNLFKEFFNLYETSDAAPSVLTSEISIMQSYVDHVRINDSCCILDLGHKTTKAYFIHERQIVSNHTSFVAGETINEVISKTYQIKNEEAISYKHKNSFLLTDDQLNEVSEEQKDFALLMKQIFIPLILDIRRWEIGHRVKFGQSIDKIIIMGGTSQINGLSNFLYFHTGLPVENFIPLTELKNDYDIHEKTFFITKMMGVSQKFSSNLINFLTGHFHLATNSFISLHSAAFFWFRSTIIALILIASLLTEKYLFLNKNEKLVDSKSIKILKASSIGLSKKDLKNVSQKPENVLNLIKKKNKVALSEIKMILNSLNEKNGLSNLALLSKILNTNEKVSLVKFLDDGTNVIATFTAKEITEIEALKTKLETSHLPNLKINYKSNELNLTIEFANQG